MKFLKLYLKNLAILLLMTAALIIFWVGVHLAISHMGDRYAALIFITTFILGLAWVKTIDDLHEGTEESK